MIALDTSVVVRLLVADDPDQCRRARRLVEDAETRGEPLWLAEVVWCETVWALESCYPLSRETISATLARLARARHVVLQSPDQVTSALASYGRGGADFADYLIVEQAKAAGCDHLVSFGRKLLAVDRVEEP